MLLCNIGRLIGFIALALDSAVTVPISSGLVLILAAICFCE
jgi:hypothetical protein